MKKNKTFEIRYTKTENISLKQILDTTDHIERRGLQGVGIRFNPTHMATCDWETFNVSQLNEKEFKMLIEKMDDLNNKDIKELKEEYNKGDNDE